MGRGGNAKQEGKKNHRMQGRGGRKRRGRNEMELSSGLLPESLIIDHRATGDVRQCVANSVGVW